MSEQTIVDRRPEFVTSDWHLGHVNVLKYDSRPFTDINHMHRVLVNNHNSCVPPNGITFFLGDMGYRTDAGKVEKIIRELNGTKVLILGNHDRGSHSMYSQGFDVVLNSAMIYLGENRITMSHCPLPGVFRESMKDMPKQPQNNNWHGEHKNTRFTTWDNQHYHLHGHIHSDGVEKPRSTHNQFDVGVRANGYRTVSMSVIEAWIASTKKVQK